MDLSKYSGVGMESMEGISSTMPFIQIIQNGSPEIKKSHEQHQTRKVEGAEEGDLVFLPEKLLFKGDEGVVVIPLAFRSVYTEWRPKTAGGGFVGVHPLGVVSHPNYKRIENKEYIGDNELIHTIYVAVEFHDPQAEEWKRAILSFTSTQLKKARNWSKIISSFRYKDNPKISPPIFACSYRIKTKAESNDSGDWYGWDISVEQVIQDENLLDMALNSVKEAQEDLPSPSARQYLPETGSEDSEEEAF